MHLSKRIATTFTAITACGVLGLAGATAAFAGTPHKAVSNATTVCAGACFDLSSELLGPNLIQNAYKGLSGHNINLRQGGNSRTNEDFTGGFVGFVSDFCSDDPSGQGFLNTSYVCLHYSNFPVFEADFSPDNNESGLCVGIATPGINNENTSLQPCGATNKTLWIGDVNNGDNDTLNYLPWINGSDTQFTHPLVLRVQDFSQHPANRLVVTHENLSGGEAISSELFNITGGPFS